MKEMKCKTCNSPLNPETLECDYCGSPHYLEKETVIQTQTETRKETKTKTEKEPILPKRKDKLVIIPNKPTSKLFIIVGVLFILILGASLGAVFFPITIIKTKTRIVTEIERIEVPIEVLKEVPTTITEFVYITNDSKYEKPFLFSVHLGQYGNTQELEYKTSLGLKDYNSLDKPYLHIYGVIFNIGYKRANNVKLHVKAYQEGSQFSDGNVVAIDTYIELGYILGREEGKSSIYRKQIDIKVYYYGSSLYWGSWQNRYIHATLTLSYD